MPTQCERTDILGDKLTTQGIKPNERQISAIMNMESPKS